MAPLFSKHPTGMELTSDSSSPDPIALLPSSSSPKRPHTIARGALVSKSHNVVSPSKSMILETGEHGGKSPWRIKVTVEAEPSDETRSTRTSPAPKPRRATNATTVPSKDPDQGSPVKRIARPRRLITASQRSQSRDARKPTPPRRRVTPGRKSRSGSDDAVDAATAEVAAAVTMNDASALPSQNDDLKLQDKDEAMWRAMTSNAEPRDQDVDSEYSLSDDEHPVAAPGDATVLENEEFSMISVDSLGSAQVNEPSPGQSLLRSTRLPKSTNTSYMPSSPPLFQHDLSTPLMEESSPHLPAPPIAPFLGLPKVTTPLQQGAVRSGRVLQDIVRSPLQKEAGIRASLAKETIFAGFSSGTKRQLRASLQIGQGLADTGSISPLPHLENTFGRSTNNRSTSTTSINSHRLPTPDERDADLDKKSSSTDVEAGIQYPTLTTRVHQVHLDSPRSPYDAMSWVHTGPGKLASPIESSLCSSRPTSQAKSMQSFHEQPTEVVEISSDESSDLSDASAVCGAIEEEASKDIWQEEASRSIEDDQQEQPSTHLQDPIEASVKPRRAKLPRTWRRQSANNFHYSDSPEPEQGQVPQDNGSNSSRKSSSALTPPTTEDEGTADEQDTVKLENVFLSNQAETPNEEVDRQCSLDEALSPGSDSSANTTSPEGEDTGLFWQSNLPNVFSKRRRPSLHKDATDFSVLSDLRHPLASSPLKNTVMDDSVVEGARAKRSPLRMRPLTGKIKRSPNASRIMGTPLRSSLLKSSKLRCSPLPKSSNARPQSQAAIDDSCEDDLSESDNQESEEEYDDEELDITINKSVASDTRQLLLEEAAHQRRTSMAAPKHEESLETVATTESEVGYASESEVSTSYQEELNLASPSRVAVKFNDSSTSCILAPKRDYPPLFDNVPDLQPQAHSSQALSSSPMRTLVGSKPASEPGVFSRLTSSFWSAVKAADPSPEDPRQVTTGPDAVGPTVPDITLRLRRKYGLLPNIHPFTHAHARTLTRMLNSVRQHPTLTIIPTAGPLPPSLFAHQGTIQVNAYRQSTKVTREMLHIVHAYSQLLVPEVEITRLESGHMGKWGDEEARKARGFDGRGRHGSYAAFPTVKKGWIEEEYVLRTLAGIYMKDQRETKRFEQKKYEDRDDSVLHKVEMEQV